MTDEELFGKLMAAMASLQSTVATQTSQINKLATEVMQLRAVMERLPCRATDEHDTNPECLQGARDKMHSISEDEPDSVVTRQMDFRASKSGIEVKGPSIMVIALTAVAAMGVAAWTWLRHQLP